jgi:YidC/Oxa1 family membrane protein insertase
MTDNRNTILAVILSGLVLIGWQYFFNIPQMEKQRAAQLAQTQTTTPAQNSGSTAAPQASPLPSANAPATNAPANVASGSPATVSRETAIAATPRVRIDTPRLSGSISLKGARIDDLSLVKFRETVDPTSPPIVLFSPSGTANPYYAEFGWVAASGSSVKMPDQNTLWQQESSGNLTPANPVTLKYDNGDGLTFRRIISIDDRYLFTVKDDVSNVGSAPVTLYPFGLISRHGKPKTAGYAVRHEGPIGVMGDQCLRQGFSIVTECQEESYETLDKQKALVFTNIKNTWFGITDVYWAATLIPDPGASLNARFSSNLVGGLNTYQADYLLEPTTIAIGGTRSAQARLFGGPREVAIVDQYDRQLKLNRFELLIDWGRFYFITRPMFWALDWLYHLVGNFGVAILLLTVLVKLVFFPLANKSYASMAKMKSVQPQLAALKERYPDDKVKQQQEMMEIYKKEKINPIAGCLPVALQIPVFFSLYKVLFVTIEMRHAPFFGWIRDLSAPDPTNLFNLFGLFSFDPTQLPLFGPYLALGVWPIIMGITMWFQFKLNPTPPDPTQQMIFGWMPLIFTFMLAGFPAGLVIYWAWNNLLSVLQQSLIMHRNGVKVELFDNLKSTFASKKAESKT